MVASSWIRLNLLLYELACEGSFKHTNSECGCCNAHWRIKTHSRSNQVQLMIGCKLWYIILSCCLVASANLNRWNKRISQIVLNESWETRHQNILSVAFSLPYTYFFQNTSKAGLVNRSNFEIVGIHRNPPKITKMCESLRIQLCVLQSFRKTPIFGPLKTLFTWSSELHLAPRLLSKLVAWHRTPKPTPR